MDLIITKQWDQTLFFLATLSLAFIVGCVFRILLG